MHTKRPEEFHIAIRWKPGLLGGILSAGVPGFYAKAGWVNEGEAFYPIDDLRLPPGLIQDLCNLLARSFDLPAGLFERDGAALKVAHDAAASAHADRLRARVRALQQQLADAEAAVSELDNPSQLP